MSSATPRPAPHTDVFKVIESCLESDTTGLLEAAVWLSAIDRYAHPSREKLKVPLTHVKEIRAEAVRICGPIDSKGDRIIALQDMLRERFAFHGDRETYDSPENTDMVCVLERRKGLPVALAIVVIDVLRVVGIGAEGLSFPGHFLLRAYDGSQSIIIDAFNDFQSLSPTDLRILAKQVMNPDVELRPFFFEAVDDRTVLYRLINNIKIRAIQSSDFERAISILNRLTFLKPNIIHPIHEKALVQARIGDLNAAIESVEMCLKLVDPSTPIELVSTLKVLHRRYQNEQKLT